MSRIVLYPIWAALITAGSVMLVLGGTSTFGLSMRTALFTVGGISSALALSLVLGNRSRAISNSVGTPWIHFLTDVLVQTVRGRKR